MKNACKQTPEYHFVVDLKKKKKKKFNFLKFISIYGLFFTDRLGRRVKAFINLFHDYLTFLCSVVL